MKHMYSVCPSCGKLGQFGRHCHENPYFVGGRWVHTILQDMSPEKRIEVAKLISEATCYADTVAVVEAYASKKAKKKISWR